MSGRMIVRLIHSYEFVLVVARDGIEPPHTHPLRFTKLERWTAARPAKSLPSQDCKVPVMNRLRKDGGRASGNSSSGDRQILMHGKLAWDNSDPPVANPTTQAISLAGHALQFLRVPGVPVRRALRLLRAAVQSSEHLPPDRELRLLRRVGLALPVPPAVLDHDRLLLRPEDAGHR